MIISILFGLIFGFLIYIISLLFINNGKFMNFNLYVFIINIIVTIIVFCLNYYINGNNFKLIITDLLIAFLLIVFNVDWNKMIIPDTINIGIFLLVITSIIFLDFKFYYSKNDLFFMLIINTLITIIVIGINVLYKIEIIGFGDIKLFFSIGLFFGFKLFLIGIFIACIIATLIELIIYKLKRRVLPFGPYLACGFIFVIIFKEFLSFLILF